MLVAVMPVPKPMVLVLAKCVFCPTIQTERLFCPCAPVFGVMERREADGAVTVNALAVAVWTPLATVTDRGPGAALGAMINWTVAVVALVTVTIPDWPIAAVPTDIPAPKFAFVLPWT
jgi:hypothetical protein